MPVETPQMLLEAAEHERIVGAAGRAEPDLRRDEQILRSEDAFIDQRDGALPMGPLLVAAGPRSSAAHPLRQGPSAEIDSC